MFAAQTQPLALSAGSLQLRTQWKCNDFPISRVSGQGLSLLGFGFRPGLLSSLQTHHGLQRPGFSSSVSSPVGRVVLEQGHYSGRNLGPIQKESDFFFSNLI